MTQLNLSSLSPVNLAINGGAAAVLATEQLSLDPGIGRELFRHSGNKFGSTILKLGATPIISFSTPFLPAWNLFGWAGAKVTTCDFQFGSFADFQKQSGSVHDKYSLATAPGSAIAEGRIVSTRVNQKGILMAEVAVLPLSYDRMTHPLKRTTNTASPN